MAMKRLIILTDGTWNSKDAAKADGEGLTNVARMYVGIADQDAAGVQQVAHYHTGVGTGPWWDRLVGGAFGVGIGQIIRECYDWLVANYAPGDELFFFGFSRGAYTAEASSVSFATAASCVPSRSSVPRHRNAAPQRFAHHRDDAAASKRPARSVPTHQPGSSIRP